MFWNAIECEETDTFRFCFIWLFEEFQAGGFSRSGSRDRRLSGDTKV